MLCPMTDNGPREMSCQEFFEECVGIQNAGECAICESGKFARLGVKDMPPPEGVKFVPSEEKVQREEPGVSTAVAAEIETPGFAGDDRLKPIPQTALDKLTPAGFKPYWLRGFKPETCANCGRSPIKIVGIGCCYLCYGASRGKQGLLLIQALAEAVEKAKHVKRRGKSAEKKQKKASAPKQSGKQAPKTDKSPHDVMPRRLWEEQRLGDLARGINSYIDAGKFKEPCVAEWCREIQELLVDLINDPSHQA